MSRERSGEFSPTRYVLEFEEPEEQRVLDLAMARVKALIRIKGYADYSMAFQTFMDVARKLKGRVQLQFLVDHYDIAFERITYYKCRSCLRYFHEPEREHMDLGSIDKYDEFLTCILKGRYPIDDNSHKRELYDRRHVSDAFIRYDIITNFWETDKPVSPSKLAPEIHVIEERMAQESRT